MNQKATGKAAAKVVLNGKKKREYKLKTVTKVAKDAPLYGVVFNFLDSRFLHLVTTCGSNRVAVFDTSEKGSLKCTRLFVDADKSETFYTVCWSADPDGRPLLVASGNCGVIRVIDYTESELRRNMIGHGGAVNEVKAHILKPWFILSAGKDESVRLWNAHRGVCVLILAGITGHRNEVLSVDFQHVDLTRVASCGMDGTVKIWNIKDFLPTLEQSETWTGDPTTFPTKYVQFPLFVAESVHHNYVDCVRWFADCLLSKSVDEEIRLWKYAERAKEGQEGRAMAQERCLLRYFAPECDIWFIKFSIDFEEKTIAVGNREGKIYLFDMLTAQTIAKLSSKACTSVVRQTALSYDGSIVIACCEDGSLYRWDLEEPAPQ